MIHDVANANVPKFTLIVGASNGAGNYAMCGRGYNPRMLWMLPHGRISVMGGEQAADVLASVKINQLLKEGQKLSDADIAAIREPILNKYEIEGSPYFSTSRIWDDGIIDPLDIRTVLGLGIAMSLNQPIPEHNFGVFRM